MFSTCLKYGTVVYPRGQEIREVQDYPLIISPQYPFMSFKNRDYKYEYFKKEMLWKLGASKYDESIKEHAKMWASVQNPDGTFNSNYGQYWFGEQRGFWGVVEELARDKDSRQAVIPMLNASHMTPQTVDKVCTTAVGFRIRNDHLLMSVQMRSSDQVFGLGTDIPTFSFLYRMVFAALRGTYPSLSFGTLNISAMSSHIYSRHYNMIDKVLEEGLDGYEIVDMPFIDSMAEVLFLISTRGKYEKAPAEFRLANWLIEEAHDETV